MKKLAAFLMIPALAMLMVPALASADDWSHREAGDGIRGLYAVTGFSTCSPVGPGIFEADYRFNGNGTGSVRNGFVRSLTWANINWTSSPADKPMVVNAGFVHYTVDFKYKVTHDGRITFEYPWGGNHIVKKDADDNLTLWEVTWNLGPGHGVISRDGETITITCGPPVVLEVIASQGAPGVTGFPPVGYKTSCVTSGVGVRLR